MDSKPRHPEGALASGHPARTHDDTDAHKRGVGILSEASVTQRNPRHDPGIGRGLLGGRGKEAL